MDQTRKSNRNEIISEIVTIIDHSDNVHEGLLHLARGVDKHDFQKIFDMLEDPYSDFNYPREEYSGDYWELWKKAWESVHPIADI